MDFENDIRYIETKKKLVSVINVILNFNWANNALFWMRVCEGLVTEEWGGGLSQFYLRAV